jgi:hypothetical protein
MQYIISDLFVLFSLGLAEILSGDHLAQEYVNMFYLDRARRRRHENATKTSVYAY